MLPSLLLSVVAAASLPALTWAKPIIPSKRAVSDACARASEAADQYFTDNSLDPSESYAQIPADVAYECLTSVPLHKAPAIQLVNSLKAYFQVHSTVDFLRTPPTGYLYPPLDLPRGLDDILKKLEDEEYNSEYDFQVALTALINLSNDGHFSAQWDLSSLFLFLRGADTILTSVSSDGKEIPKVYRLQDQLSLDANEFEFVLSDAPISAVSKINGIDVNQFLQLQGQLTYSQDPDNQYNQVVFTVGKNLYPNMQKTMFQVTTFYPGPETVLTFENGSTYTSQNVARVTGDLTGIASGEDVYQRFCIPKSTNTTSTSDEGDGNAAAATQTYSATAEPTRFPQYPAPTVLAESGMVSGYFLEAAGYEDVAVLAIRSFAGDSANFMIDFQDAVQTFLTLCRKQQKTKLILDLQGNGGGYIDLGTDLMAQLFPDSAPNTKSDLRASTGMALLMQAASDYVAASMDVDTTTHADETEVTTGDYAVPFAFQTVMTPEADNFNNLHDYYGPYSRNHGTFTNFFQSNYTNDLPSEWDSTRIDITGYGNRSENVQAQVFKPENMIVLTDGYCASTCTVVSEGLKNNHGVQFIVVGGRPQTGPMQAIGGVKGSQIFETSVFTGLLQWWQNPKLVNIAEAAGTPWADFDEIPIGRGFGGVNGRNHYRIGDTSTTALQFVYEAADCRIWHTAEMITDITVMWDRVAELAFKDRDQNGVITSEYCVQDSTKHPTSISGGLKKGSIGPQTPPANAKPKYSGYLLNGTKVVDSIYNGGANAGVNHDNTINSAALRSLKDACHGYDGSKWFVKLVCSALG